MKIDIAICTWNRSRLLRDTLISISQANVPAGTEVRIIVVDNNSTDDTSATVQEFQQQLQAPFSLLLTQETQQGHTYSRNRAVESADSDLLIWTDDDVLVDENWIISYAAAFEDSNVSFWGGKIIPIFPNHKPDWIDENWPAIKGCFAERDLGDSPLELSLARLPYGANFAIRTSVQKEFLFDTRLGRKKNYVSGEDEIDLFQRLINAGHKGRWVPGSKLKHVICDQRSTESYIRNYFVGQGQALVSKGKPWSNQKSKMWFHQLYESVSYRLKRPFAKSPAWMAHLIRSGLAQGQYQALTHRDE